MADSTAGRRLEPLGSLLSLAACVLVLGIAGCHAARDEVRLTLAHSLEPTHTVHRAMLFMNKRLQELSAPLELNALTAK